MREVVLLVALLNPLILGVGDPDATLVGRRAGRTGKFPIGGCGADRVSTGEALP